MHGDMGFLHGSPLVNSEVAHLSQISSNPLGLGYWAETWRKKKKFGPFAPKPNIRVSLRYVFSLKECSRIFIFLLD